MYKIFITIGVVFIIIGLMLYLFKDFPLFRLPGDIYIDKPKFCNRLHYISTYH